jgi:hypothetical protein
MEYYDMPGVRAIGRDAAHAPGKHRISRRNEKMLIAKKHLSRRTLLRGAGVAIALPQLDSMVPAQTPQRKTAAAGRTRFAAIEIVHGAAKHYWSPIGEGSDFETTSTLQSAEPYRDDLTIVSGTDLNKAAARFPRDGKTTALMVNRGIGQRRPQGVNGAHTLIVRAPVVEIAQKLGNAIVAPVISPNRASAALPGTIGISTAVSRSSMKKSPNR